MNSKKTRILVIFIITAAAVAGFARQQGEQLSSSQTAQALYDTGYELYTDKDAGFSEAKQAIIFFNAAINLDGRANYVLPDIINIAWQYPAGDFSSIAQLSLDKYMDSTSDLEIVSKAVQYLLEKLSSREEREQLLQNLLDRYGQKNQFFASDLLTQLGFFKAETADINEAQRYFMQACVTNGYNRLAFNKLAELIETGGGQLPAITYLQNLRFAVRVNPLDLKSAFDFARLSESIGLYEPAAAGYRYCTQLYKYLNPAGPFPAEFYRPWMLNCYNKRDYRLCQEILEQVRGYGVFDIMVEAIAAASARQGGDIQGSQTILDSIEKRADKILTGQIKASAGELQDFAWFFSFAADANSQDMLTWATKAYGADSNSVSAGSFFAYALVKNNQIELARPVLEKIGTDTQTSIIARAEIFAADKDANSAINMFKSAVDAASGTFEAQKAKARLKELGSEYVPAVDSDAIVVALRNDFGQTFFADFVPPEKMITVELKTGGTAFAYGSQITTQLAIVNNSLESLVICPDGIFKGNIRADIRVSGDLSDKIDNFIVKVVRPSNEIKPGQALFVPLQFVTGRLKSIMDCHPQADLNLEITVYIDPQVGSDGQVRSFYGIKPAKVVLKRRKLDLTTQYLQQRFDSMDKGQQGQKIKSAQLFAGLLAEQQKLSQMGTKYRFAYAEPELLSSALAKCLAEDDWILKVQTIAVLLKVKLDYRLIETVSAQLDNNYWPVRLMTAFILAENQGDDFMPVLKWMVENDNSPMVKDMAATLSGVVITIKEKVADANDKKAADANMPETSLEKPVKQD